MIKGKVTIVGAGAVGSATAFALARSGLAREIVLQDLNLKRAQAEALDIAHGSLFYPAVSISWADNAAKAADSEIVVITAGARQKEGQTRIDLAGDSIKIMESVLPALFEVAPEATYLIVANPVDICTYVAGELAAKAGIPVQKVFGSGTALDSSRLRTLLADKTGINPKNIHAYIAGEHGDSEITLWSSATIGNTPLLEFKELPGFEPLSATVRDEIHSGVVNAAYKVIEGKGATNYAIAAATIDILEAVLRDEKRIMPVSGRFSGLNIGGENVCMSLPAVVGKCGICAQLNVALSRDEVVSLQESAKMLRHILEENGY